MRVLPAKLPMADAEPRRGDPKHSEGTNQPRERRWNRNEPPEVDRISHKSSRRGWREQAKTDRNSHAGSRERSSPLNRIAGRRTKGRGGEHRSSSDSEEGEKSKYRRPTGGERENTDCSRPERGRGRDDLEYGGGGRTDNRRVAQHPREEMRWRNTRWRREIEESGTDSSESSESEYDTWPERRGRRPFDAADRNLKCIKILQSWKLHFSGEGREGPEEYLKQLEECQRKSKLSGSDLLGAVSCTLSLRAKVWYQTVYREIETWKEFKKAFRRQFIGGLNQEELEDELRRRTQAKGEKVENFLTCFKYIIGHFRRPPTEAKQIALAYRNLLPEYRKAMEDKEIYSLADIGKYGRRWERKKEVHERYLPPPPKEKMRSD